MIFCNLFCFAHLKFCHVFLDADTSLKSEKTPVCIKTEPGSKSDFNTPTGQCISRPKTTSTDMSYRASVCNNSFFMVEMEIIISL